MPSRRAGRRGSSSGARAKSSSCPCVSGNLRLRRALTFAQVRTSDLEQEIKLAFEHIEAARRAVQTAGGRLDISARLLDDQLFDTPDAQLRRAGTGLRIRRDGARTFLTFKGPVQPGPVKSREE